MALKFRRGNNAQKSGSLAFGEPYVNTSLGTLQIGLDTGDVTLQVAGTGSVGTFGHISGSSLEISGDATIGGNLTLGGNITIGDQTTDTIQVTANLSSSLIPSNDNTFDLGSTNKKYRDVYVGRNITIDGNTTLGNDSGDTITFSGSVNSHIVPSTGSGEQEGQALYDLGSREKPFRHLYISTGSIYYIGANGQTAGNLGLPSAGGLAFDGDIRLSGSIHGTGSASSIYMRGDAKFTGSISASTFTGLGNLTTYSTSVDSRLQSLVSRASNLELDSASQDSRLDNLESTSASLLIETSNLELFSASTLTRLTNIESASGSAIGRLNNLESTSASVNISVGALNTFSASTNSRLNNLELDSASQDSRLDNLEAATASYEIKGNNIVSGSSNTANVAISINSGVISANLTGGVISGSAQLTAALPENVVSASTDTANVDITITAGNISANLKGGVVSGSSQIDATQTTNWASGIKTQLDTNTVVSGSAQVVGILGSLNTYTQSNDTTNTNQNNRLTSLETASGSAIGRLNNLETTSASVNTSISNLNLYTQSNDTTNTNQNNRLTSIEGYTSSLKTAIGLNGTNVTVFGDLSVQGTTTQINSTQVNIGENILELNFGGSANVAGIYAKDATGGSTVSGSLLWDATNDRWIAGKKDAEAKVLTDGLGVISGSAQLAASLPDNVVSASTDTANVDITITAGVISADLKGGVVSGSSQIDATQTTNWATGIKTQLDANTVVSGSAQVIGILNSLNSYTQSNDTTNTAQNARLTSLEAATSSYETMGRNIVSASTDTANVDITITDGVISANLKGGVISGSAQLTAALPDNVVSASSDTANIDITISSGVISADLKGGVVSGSSQIDATQTTNWASGIKTQLDTNTVVSGSSQITYSGLSGIPAGIVSGAAQVTPLLPAGTISGSSQVTGIGNAQLTNSSITIAGTSVSLGGAITLATITGGSGILSGSSQLGGIYETTGRNIVSASTDSANIDFTITNGNITADLKGGVVSGSSQVSYTGLSNIPAGIVSGAAQITPLLPTGTVSGSSQVSYTGLSNIPAGIISSSAQLGSVQTAVTSSYPINITGSWNQRSLYSVDPAAGPGMPTVDSIVFGNLAGETASDSTTGVIFIGTRAGRQAPKTAYSVFIGQDAGGEAIDSSNAVMIGLQAGQYSSGSDYSVIIGQSAAQNTDYLVESVVLGLNTAQGATNASRSVFIGTSAGAYAANASFSTFIGYGAGGSANGAYESNFIGFNAGDTATDAWRSNFIGYYAGSGSANAHSSNFIGREAGANVDNAFVNAIGYGAGKNATNATNSNFIGAGAGQDSANASYSVILGTNAGRKHPTGNGISSNNIIIGSNVSLPNDRKDSINFGGIIFATGSHSNMAMDAFTGSVGNGKVGINVVLPDEALHVSGNVKVSGNLLPGSSISTLGTAANPWKDLYVSTGSIYYVGAGGQVVGTLGLPTAFGLAFDGNVILSGSIYGSGSNSSIYMRGNAEFTGSVSASTFTGLGNLTTYSTSVDSRIVALTSATSSYQSTLSVSDTATVDLTLSSNTLSANLIGGVVSGSSQVSYTGLSNIPAGIVSGSSQISHDSTTGYSANRHIDHTAVTITAGNGLSGGGDISATRTLTVDTASAHFLGGSRAAISVSDTTGASGIDLTYSSTTGVLSGVLANSAITIAGTSTSLGGSITLATITAGSGIVSGSSQVSYTGLSNIPAGIVSGSSQITPLLPTGTVSGSSQVYSGVSGDITIASNGVATIAANSVALGTDTTGDYVASLVAGTNITLSNNSGEGATPTIGLTNNAITIAGTSTSLGGSITLATITGGSGIVSGSSQVASGVYSGVSGDITIASNGVATIAANSVALGTDTTGNYMADVSAGTGVTVTHTPGEGSTATIAIGQAVGTGNSPTFAGLTINGSITATGDITAYYSSDKRFKDNIVEIDGALEKVRKIRGVKWTWNDLTDDVMKQAPTTGLIAQEVQEVLPEVVKQREDGYLGLDYAKMMGLMVEAIKEQQLQIEKLQIELNNCKNNKGL